MNAFLPIFVCFEHPSSVFLSVNCRPSDEINIFYDYMGTLRPFDIREYLIDSRTMWEQMCFNVGPDDALLKRLSTVYGTDFSLCSGFFRRYALRQTVPTQYRKNNHLTYENVRDGARNPPLQAVTGKFIPFPFSDFWSDWFKSITASLSNGFSGSIVAM